MHLADAFIQSDLQCIQVTVSTFDQLFITETVRICDPKALFYNSHVSEFLRVEKLRPAGGRKTQYSKNTV